jgi:hypothetical protein
VTAVVIPLDDLRRATHLVHSAIVAHHQIPADDFGWAVHVLSDALEQLSGPRALAIVRLFAAVHTHNGDAHTPLNELCHLLDVPTDRPRGHRTRYSTPPVAAATHPTLF